ncbi:putative DNA-directed RNA polymerase I subunit RPA43-like [Apostichopus japonicus]|uniref:Putative DNA-directed RNA polymerase I subunit RPA43-like n=1 Tax=Stichopus japonicus TaxID=307972 RepID=A0A2G8JPR3_STIJA|nr:putative DNA-directed RNA polymerase I subunit RPA43-like [Apostichopus japonicus]
MLMREPREDMQFNEAVKLAQDPLSGCVVISEHVHHLSLPPRYIGNIKTGVKEILRKLLGRYNNNVDGILLAYSNIKITQRNAVLLYDDVDMHMDVRYDAVIFRVVPGSLLKCKINEVSAAHISCLTHKIINITVELPDINFDLHDPKGLEIVCRLKKVEYQKGVLGLSAELTDDSLNTLQELCINDDGSKGHGAKHKKKQKRQKNKSSRASNTADPGSVGLSDEGKEGSETNGDGPKEPGDAIINDDGSKGHGRKHKKKQKRQANKSSGSSDMDVASITETFNENTGENRRKHRKERKQSEIMEVVEHDLDLPSPDEIDELIQKKKTRKRKQERLPVEGQFDSGSVDYASTGNTSSIKRKKIKH